MKSTNPIIINGKTYDRYSLNLIVSGIYTPEGQPDVALVCDLLPTRIEGNTIQTAPQNTIHMRLGALDQADAQTLQTVSAIHSALQTFLTQKGL